ncbi:EAL domain-containing protein [Xanthomonas campestris pv. raphani]|uniref:EAL domain-containing protein n=1 Tax=Xanthomonas campestris TaxID=339 RepID=UPI00236768BA|nr:EAL domain-containing protein [Xanthomonas campestris]MEA9754489.1 EAL domain-containing protein [Xanthomonas campestris pv. raphani]MEA9764806.1 EAL domain-containing protein [Xanthomonas campestris pv. raphani]MEA9814234.1 EAL domain-containing protein [Xanthomonas campestris pv. raphani]MEA9825220.1 EAL domain-containing protein [Xanthomonas campestris pv. raphani]MEA9850643.1 EAL domain-containing protein [Xanthomonas campestris pv. raphani]
MQKGKDLTLRLMIVDDSVESAEAIVTALRNGGIAVRPSRPQTPEELGSMLSGQIDLAVQGQAQQIPMSALQQQIAGSGKDIPIIQLADRIEENALVEAAAHGVRAIALRHRTEHLLALVRSEWADLQARRGLRRIEAQMRETERRCDALIASSRDPIAYVHEGMHIRANEAYLEMFGFESFEDVEGVSLLDMIAAQYVDDFKQLLKALSKGEPPPAQYKVDARRLEGDTFPATMEFATATYEGEPCIQVVFRRREEFDPELAREVEDLRQRDQVTGLLNRPTFMVALEQAVAQAGRSEGQSGFLLIEPDHYARILPEIGLDSADALIASMAAHLASVLDDSVVAARFGEHSFALLMDGNYARSHALAELVRDAFAQHVFSVGERSATVTVSIGGVQIGEKIASIGQVLNRGTEEVRTTAELGGNAVSIFDPAAADRAEEERIERWVEQLREALIGDGFLLHYQPVLNLQGEPLELYQAFLRLERNGEMMSPNAFMAIAEEHDLITEIDRWVVARAIRQLGERQRAGHKTHLLVRIGPNSFSDPQMIDTIREQLAVYGVPGERLWLQTPESKVFTHLRNAQQFLASVSAMGCKVGLEQFGSGLDSFQLLAHFQPAFLKLDRGITGDIASARESQEKIREITSRAQPTGILTVAEFVADAQSMSSFFTAGVDYVQGDFVAPTGPLMNYEFG